MHCFLLFCLYLAVSAIAYRIYWPDGLFSNQPDPERDRLRRLGRRRVLPVPHDGAPHQ